MSSRNHHDQHVIKSGYLKKLKTSRRKYFVLRAETAKTPARLEYYDSEKKFVGGQNPKRAIPLKTCFNINKNQLDAKHRHVVALYTKDDVFSVAFDGEDDLEAWYKALLSLQRGEEVIEGKVPKPTFEHVWQVTIAKRGLGGNLFPEMSVYRLCLTDKVLSLIRKDSIEPQLELSLSSIRSCGNLKTFFYLEIGRSSSLGAGELWMETEDAYIAQNVHATVFHAMSTNSSSREELGPKSRIRSSSATESSKPTNVGRRQNQPNPICGVPKPIPHVTDATSQNTADVQHHGPSQTPVNEMSCMHQRSSIKASERRHSVSGFSGGRERCDSMPSRARTTSEGNHFISFFNRPHFRPPSLYKESPSGSPVSPPSAAGSTDSAGSSLSIDEPDNTWTDTNDIPRYSHSLTPDEAIVEENFEDCPDGNFMMRLVGNSSYIPMNPGTTDDGYVKMQARNQHMSPTASLSSVTSGTPSTDMKFAEYTLEKVPSYFTPSEDDETSSTDRPTRAYSFGSHPDSYKYRSIQAEAARERACSFGAKTKKMQRILQHPQSNTGSKSSSAPLLSNSRMNSHGSSDPMNDLMEIDFSKSKDGKINRVPPGYVEMKPGSLENNRPAYRNGEDVTGVSGYVDMKCGRSPVKTSLFYYMKRNSPPKSSGYMEMDPRKKMATSPLSPSFLPSVNDYMDMNAKKSSGRTQPTGFARLSGHYDDSTPSSIEFIDEDEPKPKPHTFDGYVEMNAGKSKSSHNRQSSLNSAKINVGDYTNMSCGVPISTATAVTSTSSSKKKERKLGNRSQPIQIQSNTSAQYPKSSSPSNPPLYGRKFSTGTPPKMFLNLNTSSLPRQKSKKASSRRDSKDSSSSSVTTPSSSSTIFPISINSPCSPVRPSGEGNPLESDAYTSMDFSKPASKNGGEYVNYNPAKPKQQECGDYALMKPSNPAASVLVMPLSTMNLVESKCFRPIPETNESGTISPRQSIDSQMKESESPKNSRPNSVNGDGTVTSRPASVSSEGALVSVSRPSSTSSELNSVTSTIVGSRPSSVNSDRIRPPSVTSELCYASLDLEDGGSKSPRSLKPQTQTAEGVPVPLEQDPTFSYAKIDFAKSEGFKHNPLLPNNAKVKH